MEELMQDSEVRVAARAHAKKNQHVVDEMKAKTAALQAELAVGERSRDEIMRDHMDIQEVAVGVLDDDTCWAVDDLSVLDSRIKTDDGCTLLGTKQEIVKESCHDTGDVDTICKCADFIFNCECEETQAACESKTNSAGSMCDWVEGKCKEYIHAPDNGHTETRNPTPSTPAPTPMPNADMGPPPAAAEESVAQAEESLAQEFMIKKTEGGHSSIFVATVFILGGVLGLAVQQCFNNKKGDQYRKLIEV